MPIIKWLGRGLKIFFDKIVTKLEQIRGKPENIAKGFATGVAVSFTPFVGFHLIIALMLTKILKQSGVAAALGTLFGNPWTFPLIWFADLSLGKFFLSQEGAKQAINFAGLFKELFHCVIMLDFDRFFSDIYPVFMPMLIGCIPLCMIAWILCSHLILCTLRVKQAEENKDDTGTGM